MENISFFATLDKQKNIELLFCTDLPDFVHMVKTYSPMGIEVYFDADVLWTAEQEELVEGLLHEEIFAYA